MKTLAQFSTRRPLVVVLAWLVAVLGIGIASSVVGSSFRDTFALPGTDSQAAYDLLAERFPGAAGSADTLAWTVAGGSVTDPEVQATMEVVMVEISEVDHVAAVTSPYTPEGASQISRDGTVAFAQVHWDGQAYGLPAESVRQVYDIIAGVNGHDGITVALGGQGAQVLSSPSIGVGEILGVAIAALILFVAFGSLLATTVPLASALVAVIGTVKTLGLMSHVWTLSTPGTTIAILLGLGLGIDYALFITNRHRRGLQSGLPVRESIVIATTTSGRAVVFAGVTVFISLAGMYVPRIAFLEGLATAAGITAAFSVAASITLVPALLQLYGTRVLSRRERLARDNGQHATDTPAPHRSLAGFIERHPVATSVASVSILCALAIPMLGLRLGNANQGNDPAGSTTRVAYDLVSDGFGAGANGPLVVVVDMSGQESATAITALAASLASDPGVAASIGPIPNSAGDAAIIQVIPTTDPQANATVELVQRIRETYVVAAEAEGLTVHVGGAVATHVDFAQTISDALPVFFAVVVGLSMLVLALAFRSLVLPIVGAAVNLLSAAAAFGVVVAVFQWGWGHSLLGIGEGGPVEPYVPVILFALLFGLSMDYQVFLVTRIAELWHSTHDNRLAVRRGLAEVSRVIVAAAAIMVVVFGSFVTSDARIVKLLGLGLAAAIFLDAFVIRVTLMPAVMRLLGRANWWMPRWLDRILPHVGLDIGDPSVEDVVAERELEVSGV